MEIALRAVGVDLAALRLVGVGSICRRQDTGLAEELLRHLRSMGIRLHAFGAKFGGLVRCADALTSADSLAWSFNGRKNRATVKNGANSMDYALAWRRRLLTEFERVTPDPQGRFGW
jgi:hypothetical protein